MKVPACIVLLFSAALFLFPFAALGESDVDDVLSQDRTVGEDENRRYFLIGDAEAEPPEGGFGLIVIMPGGDGGAGFHPFVKRIYKYAVPEGYLVVQPVAVKWDDQQRIIWPTARNQVKGMRFSTEQLIADILKDVDGAATINPAKRFCMAWSSSGPPTYAMALQKEPLFTGFYIAMSVFKPDQLPPLNRAKGLPFYIEHSPDDAVCPFRMAEDARDRLVGAGANVSFTTYEGGHGWKGALWERIGTGLAWLDEQAEVSEEDDPPSP